MKKIMNSNKRDSGMLIIDDSKCKRCLKCISECPTKSLDFVANKTIQVEPSICIACGHCISVCLHNAISWDELQNEKPFSLIDYDSGSIPLSDVFVKTRSTRTFKQIDIKKNIIANIIADAEKAPSGENFRRREYFLCKSSCKVDR